MSQRVQGVRREDAPAAGVSQLSTVLDVHHGARGDQVRVAGLHRPLLVPEVEDTAAALEIDQVRNVVGMRARLDAVEGLLVDPQHSHRRRGAPVAALQPSDR